MKSSTVKKIDLTGNHLQRLKLEIMDFPLLQFLNVSFNNIDRIEAFCHESL
jgi:Leucine-rich repeat (LRR) protein